MTAVSTHTLSLSSRRAGQRLSTLDRSWLGVDNVRVLGPFDTVTARGLRASLIRMHAAEPRSHALCALDRPAARWVSLSAPEFASFSRDLVIEVADRDPEAAADAATQVLLDAPLDSRPLLLAICGGYVGAKISHAVGDGRVVNALFPELLRATAEDRTPRVASVTSIKLPLIRAALHHFGRRPSHLLDAMRISRPPRAASGGGAPGGVRNGSGGGPDSGQAGSAVVRWRPDRAYVSVRSVHALAEVRRWRDSHLPNVSAASVLFAATASALARCGLDAKWPGAVVLVDARRYLPTGHTLYGNFSWGQYLVPADLRDPRAVHAELTAQLASGGALAMLAMRTARLLLTPGHASPPPARTRPERPRPELTLTHIGRLDAYTDLPWAAAADERRNISVPTTGGPEALTVSFSELAQVLYVNASFHRSTFDPSAVRRAVELICQDPVALVGR